MRQEAETSGKRRQKLSQGKNRDDPEHHALEIETGGEDHERHRQQHDRPGVNRNHEPRCRLAQRKRRPDVGEKTDRHELRGIEDKGGARQTQ